MTADQADDPDAPPELEEEFHRVREGFETVPSLEQFEVLEALAGRLEVVVKPAQRDGQCIDVVTGSRIDTSIARELLQLGDPRHWELNVAQAHQAEIVAAVSDHADWRSVDTMQRRALSAWHLQYPELTYGTIMRLGPRMAAERLQLHRDLQDRAGPGLTLRRETLPPANDPVPDPVREPEVSIGTVPALVAIDLPAGQYTAVDSLDEATKQALEAIGLQPPDDARGYTAVDPYSTVNTLNELVIAYLDKLEVPVPTGSAKTIVEAVARYNDIDRQAELSVGQVVWFPSRKMLQSWLSSAR